VAKLDSRMVLEPWSAKITYDRGVWSGLITLRFVASPRRSILGPVGVGNTFSTTTLGPSRVAAASSCT
jgi:hypothetical protein